MKNIIITLLILLCSCEMDLDNYHFNKTNIGGNIPKDYTSTLGGQNFIDFSYVDDYTHKYFAYTNDPNYDPFPDLLNRYMRNGNVSIDTVRGELTILTEKKSINDKEYRSGSIISREPILYCEYEGEISIDPGEQGNSSAIWFWNNEGFEIDIMEYVGKNDRYDLVLHYPDAPRRYFNVRFNWDSSFNSFYMKWTKDSLIFKVNGQRILEIGEHRYHTPMYECINNAVHTPMNREKSELKIKRIYKIKL